MSTIPWVEKYRPASMNQIKNHDDKIATLRHYIKTESFPHLLLSGPSGVGKTTLISACASELYGDNVRTMVLNMNASDARGIDDVRTRIKAFVMSRSLSITGTTGMFKLVVLDETDAMTGDAQKILRKVIEQYTSNARFCLICNYQNKITQALQSRCTLFRFSPMDKDVMHDVVSNVVKEEKVNISKTAITTLCERANGDMRKAINILQSIHMVNTQKNNCKIKPDDINSILDYPRDGDMTIIMDVLINQPFATAYVIIKDLVKKESLSMKDILIEINRTLTDMIINDKTDIEIAKITSIMDKMRTIDMSQSSISIPKQVAGLVSLFNA